MSYLRGKYYTWCGEFFIKLGVNKDGEMPMDVFDQIVVMRYAELENLKEAKKIEKFVMKTNGNVGAWALFKKYGQDPAKKLNEEILKGRKSLKKTKKHEKSK